MLATTATITTRKGSEEVHAHTCGVAGLLVTRPASGDRFRGVREWVVTQIATGHRVGPYFVKLADAKRFALAIGSAADWSQGAEYFDKLKHPRRFKRIRRAIDAVVNTHREIENHGTDRATIRS